TITIINHCPKRITLGKVTNGQTHDPHVWLETGASTNYAFDGSWSGRFYGYDHCEPDSCPMAGAASPASLAEFTFGTTDYYDVSFVDGYNLPLQILPVEPNMAMDQAINNNYWCRTASCASVPACPEALLQTDGSSGCKSACSQFGNPEYCCAGSFSTLATCPINAYAQRIKDACPDVYSYAYDDQTSLFQCVASAYTVTFC
ncbi:Osmotin, thaumatin-like protein, partial [Backusella circina FSU 941]